MDVFIDMTVRQLKELGGFLTESKNTNSFFPLFTDFFLILPF